MDFLCEGKKKKLYLFLLGKQVLKLENTWIKYLL